MKHFRMPRRRWPALLIACAAALTPWGLARASSVAPMDLRALADEAGAVIIATVAEVRSYESGIRGGIDSQVSFVEVEYLKGGPPPAAHTDASTDHTFSLTVPGGTVGDRTMRLCCATEFAVGQRRLLFILPTYKTHPVVGLWQGSFPIVRDVDGVDRVYQEGMIPITEIGADWFPHTRVCPSARAADRLRGERGVRLVRPAGACEAAASMTLDAFREALRPILAASTAHKLDAPAGRRVPADLRAVPLTPSAAWSGVDPEAPAEPDNAPRADQPEPAVAPAGKAGAQ